MYANYMYKRLGLYLLTKQHTPVDKLLHLVLCMCPCEKHVISFVRTKRAAFVQVSTEINGAEKVSLLRFVFAREMCQSQKDIPTI